MTDKTAVTFTWRGALEGAKRCLPIEISGFAIGLVFGVLAGQSGLSTAESSLMSALVYSGAARSSCLGLWAAPLPVFGIALTTLVVGLRHLLIGAASALTSRSWSISRPTGPCYFMADENWALMIAEFAPKESATPRSCSAAGWRCSSPGPPRPSSGSPSAAPCRTPSAGARLRVHSRVPRAARRDVEGEVGSLALGHGGAGLGRGGAPVAAGTVVHPARRSGREPRGGGAA